MCLYRHTTYRCQHPAPDAFVQACEAYPTCNTRTYQAGTFRRRENCPECIYDKDKGSKTSKSSTTSRRSGR